MIAISTDGVPSMIGKRKGFVSRLIGDRSVFTIHCALHRENLNKKDVGMKLNEYRAKTNRIWSTKLFLHQIYFVMQLVIKK